jgi:hypothetical protein
MRRGISVCWTTINLGGTPVRFRLSEAWGYVPGGFLPPLDTSISGAALIESGQESTQVESLPRTRLDEALGPSVDQPIT